MNPYTECGPCILKWVYERVANSLGDSERFTVFRRVTSVLSKDFAPSINLGALSNRSLEAVDEFLAASSASYDKFKEKCNQAAEQLLESAKAYIAESKTPREGFLRACALASVSNVAPIAMPSAPFEFSLVEDIIKGRAPLPVASGDVYGAASKARRVFYVADNAGEIGFDSLLIALLKKMGSKVTLVVKQKPFFDDATLDDVRAFGLEKIADHVHSVKGLFVPEEADPELALRFKEGDLVISKGTGNFEALKGYGGGKKILFLLKAKCRPVSRETGTPEGDFIIRLEG
jgi:uncharacterized protein with ATP-grasp and redox domains